VLLVPGIGRVGTPAVRPAVGVSPSGILAYQNADEVETRRLAWVNRSGQPIRTLSPDALVLKPHLSPDQLFVVGNRSGGQVWVTDLGRESSERKTFDPTMENFAVWSKDGSRLAFLRAQSGIYAIDVTGGGRAQLLTQAPGVPTSWLGQHLLYNFEGTIYLLDVAEAGRPIRVGSPNGESSAGAFSPDGNYIAFNSNGSGRYEVYLRPLPPHTGETRVSINGGVEPRWKGDGKEIFYVSLDGDVMAVNIKLGDTVSVGIPHKLFHLDNNWQDAIGRGYDVAKDGQRFLMVTKSEEANSPITVVVNWWVDLEKRLGRSP